VVQRGCHPDHPSKWVAGVSPDQPLHEAAHCILDARLRAVAYWLPLAAEKSEEDVEYVHQLRVSARRAVASVRIFSDLAAEEVVTQVRGKLHAMRRAADEARNLDVLLNDFLTYAHAGSSRARQALIADMRRRRRKADTPIATVYADPEADRFAEVVARLLEEVSENRSIWATEAFGRQAARYLQPTLKKYFKASKADLTDSNAFHRLRIEAKKLRYTMEVLAVAFPDSFRARLYPQLARLQDSMGVVNDHATAVTLYAQWLKEAPNAERRAFLDGMILAEAKASHDMRQAFLATWTPRAMARLRRQFRRYTDPSHVIRGARSVLRRPR
jgi:CHAD domain-containing protein